MPFVLPAWSKYKSRQIKMQEAKHERQKICAKDRNEGRSSPKEFLLLVFCGLTQYNKEIEK